MNTNGSLVHNGFTIDQTQLDWFSGTYCDPSLDNVFSTGHYCTVTLTCKNGYRELMGAGRALTVYCYEEVWHDAFPDAVSTNG